VQKRDLLAAHQESSLVPRRSGWNRFSEAFWRDETP
jgi:hypothetical protein